MARPDRSEIPISDSRGLGRALSSIGVGTETLREPLWLTSPEHWVGHIPFAFWLISALRPRTFVELGPHGGNSYLAFCQAIADEGCATRAYAVDASGDDIDMAREAGPFEELAAYHDPRYGHFSSLIRSTCPEARDTFAEGSIDLLHIDGDHTYEATKRDFAAWESALSTGAVVLFHDTNVRRSQSGVWKFWEELSKDRPHFEFFHSCGLGVLGVGPDLPEALKRLFSLRAEEAAAVDIRAYFAARGAASIGRLAADVRDQAHRDHAIQLNIAIASLRGELSIERSEGDRARADVPEKEGQEARQVGAIARRGASPETLRTTLSGAGTECDTRGTETADIDCEPEGAGDALRIATRSHDFMEYRLRGVLDLARRILKARDEQLRQSRDDHERDSRELEQRRSIERMLRSALTTEQQRLENAVSVIEAQSTMIDLMRRSLKMREALLAGIKYDALQLALEDVDETRASHLTREGQSGSGRADIRVPTPRLSLMSGPGATEAGRIRSTGFFDERYYLETNHDVAISGEDPADHFARAGWKEGRWPNAAFDPAFYLAHNPDVAAGGLNPLLHFFDYGMFEGRPCLQLIADYASKVSTRGDADPTVHQEITEPDLFDHQVHGRNNKDASSSHVDPTPSSAKSGLKEGRRSDPSFDPLYFSSRNVEVAGTDRNAPLQCVEVGSYEERETMSRSIVETPGDVPPPRSFDGLAPQQRSIVKRVVESGLFDEDFYRAAYPDVARGEMDPVVHYSLIGWKERRRPNEYFDTAFYVSEHADVADLDINPVIHFAERGMAEGRSTVGIDSLDSDSTYVMRQRLLELETGATGKIDDAKNNGTIDRWPVQMPELTHLRDFKATHRICVVAHVYYAELWHELKDAIMRIPEPVDLFVSLVSGMSEISSGQIRDQFPSAQILVFPNRGRDILPFTTLASAGVLTQYEVICKIHTKKSPQRKDGDAWRQRLITGILPGRDGIADILSAFDADPTLGIVVADGQLFDHASAWLQNIEQVLRLAPMLGRTVSEIVNRPFAGGSIFWIRASILNHIIGLNIEPEQYEPEPIGTDGTLAHALERLFSTACYAAGMRIAQSSEVRA